MKNQEPIKIKWGKISNTEYEDLDQRLHLYDFKELEKLRKEIELSISISQAVENKYAIANIPLGRSIEFKIIMNQMELEYNFITTSKGYYHFSIVTKI